jgi:hypothetical protein
MLDPDKQRARWRRYNHSPKGRERARNYRLSPKGEEAQRRYRNSPKGENARFEYRGRRLLGADPEIDALLAEIDRKVKQGACA